MQIKASFRGDYADEHRLPAYAASQSLSGLSRVLTLSGHFLATGIVKRRRPYDSGYQFFLKPLREGSVEAVFEGLQTVAAIAPFALPFAQSISESMTYDLLKMLFRRSIGQEYNPTTDIVNHMDDNYHGHIDALIEALEPALKQSHDVVGEGAAQIVIINGDNNVVNLTHASKEYIHTSIKENGLNHLDVSIAALNANNGSGRVYFHDLGRTLPFKIDKNAADRTSREISSGLRNYVIGNGINTRIQYSRITANDDRIKSIIIYDAQTPI